MAHPVQPTARMSDRSLWGLHRALVVALAVLTAGLTLLIVLHPTLGFANGGVLDGADLRSSLVVILWSCLAAGVFVATVGVAIGARVSSRRAPVLLAAYAVAIALEPLFL